MLKRDTMLYSAGLLMWLPAVASAQAVTSVATPAPDAPAPGSAPADQGRIEDIVVTAQRRSENLQRVPISVTAVTQAALTRNVIADVTDLAAVVPGLTINNEIGYITSQLRGVGTNLLSVGFENPVAVYVDGVYYASPNASLVSFSNIERVEVLKGPQGTLFGRNATGGLINILTRNPSHTFGGSADLTYANYDTVQGDAYLTGGLTDTIAVDVAVQGAHQGKGWGKNLFSGRDAYKVDHDFSVRSKLLFESGGTKVLLSGDYADYRNSLGSQKLFPNTASSTGGGPVNLPGTYNIDSNVPQFLYGSNGGGSIQAEQDIGFAHIKSVTAYRRANLFNSVDIDETPAPALAFRLTQHDRQFSQELQLLSSGGGALQYVLGAFYFDALGKWDPFTVTIGPPNPVPLPLDVSSFDRIGTKSLAGYAQGSYALGDKTKVTLGARFTHEKRTREALQTTTAAVDGAIAVAPGVNIPVAAGTPFGPPVPFPKAHLSYSRVTFRVSLDHQFTDDILGYASFNRGFKSGGYNPAVYDQALLVGGQSYNPEQLDAYELGLKSSLFDRRVRLNVAAFYYNYSNIQLPFVIQTTVLTINAAKARIYGVDGDFEARITDAFRLTAGFQVISDKYARFPAAPIGTKIGAIPLGVGSAKGNRLSFVPSDTLNVGFGYTVGHVANGSVEIGGNAAYNSGYRLAPDNIQHQDRFVMLNASVKWTSPGGLSLTAFGKNLGDVHRISSFQQQTNGDQSVLYAAPRTYGVTAGYKF